MTDPKIVFLDYDYLKREMAETVARWRSALPAENFLQEHLGPLGEALQELLEVPPNQ